jgi:phospholipase/lecithinase/hemolysin
VRDALGAAFVGGNPLAIIASGVATTGTDIGTLYGAGARKFLIWNVADIGLTPSVRALDTQFPGPGIAATAGVLTQAYNAELAGLLATLPQTLPGIEIVPFDLYEEVNLIFATPASFGLTDVDHACITPDIPPFICKSPDDYFFWDGVHPTKTVHAIIAEDVARLLAE